MACQRKTSPTIDPSLSGSGFDRNHAVAQCVKAWQRTYDLATLTPGDDRLAPEDDNDNFFARQQAAIAFRDAMPPLHGPENVSDFIACVTFGMLKSIFSPGESARLLAAAKIALAALRIPSARPLDEAGRKTPAGKKNFAHPTAQKPPTKAANRLKSIA